MLVLNTSYQLKVFYFRNSLIKINNRNILSPINKHNLKIRSQKIENTFCDAGMINVYSQKIFEKNLKRKYFAFQIPIFSSVDIDNYSDFELAKKLFKK